MIDVSAFEDKRGTTIMRWSSYSRKVIAKPRCCEVWSFGELDILNILPNSETPDLQAAKVTIRVILSYIPVYSAGGWLTTNP